MILSTPRLVLEPLRMDHGAALFEGFRQPALYQYIDKTPPVDAAALDKRFQRVLAGPETQDCRWLNFAARQRSDGQYVGFIETTVHPGDHAYLAYFIFAPYQRLGLGSEACTAVIAHLRVTAHIHRVVAEMDTLNIGSQRLVESLGFQRTAVTPAAARFKGRISDEYRYELHLAE